MRKLIICLLVAVLPATALAAKKTSVADLKKLLSELSSQHLTDDEIANRLADLELTEQLTPEAVAALLQTQPGSKSAQQLVLLSIESSLLPPPAEDVPSQPPLDPAAQAALLQKATMLATSTVTRLPAFTADRQTIRFQSGLMALKNTSGNMVGANVGATGYSEPEEKVTPVLVEDQTVSVSIVAGVDQAGPEKQKNPASALGQVSLGVPGLPLVTVLTSIAKTQPTWLRWQAVQGRPVAVFAFAVSKKQSPYKIHYCCFPSMEHLDGAMGSVQGSATATNFEPYKSSAAFHGELYIDPGTGLVVRLITFAEPKKTDFVSQEDIRVDYEPVPIASSTYVLPTHSTVLTTVAPNGDAYVKFSERHAFFDITYKNYRQ